MTSAHFILRDALKAYSAKRGIAIACRHSLCLPVYL